MNIYINGERRQVPADFTPASLIAELALTGKRIAIEINQEVIPRSQHPSHRLREGDRVEIVHAIGGG